MSAHDSPGGSQFAIEMNTLSRSTGRHERSLSRAKSEPPDIERPLNRKDYAIGIGLLLIVVFLWTSSNFLTQDLFEGGYEKPFFVTYMNTSSFALYLLPFVFRRWWNRYVVNSKGEEVRRGRVGAGYQPLVTDPEILEPSPTIRHSAPRSGTVERNNYDSLTTEETAKLALIFSFFWFIANWSVNASLDYTSVASATILSSMSGFFTLGFGRIFRVETLTIAKIGAVLTSFVGVILVSLSDSSQAANVSSTLSTPAIKPLNSTDTHIPRAILGDSLALLSAIFYALYMILLKVRIRYESRIDMQLFFGFVGLFSVLTCWPIGILLHVTGVEKFELPNERKAIVAILVNMCITLSSDYIYVLAMLKTTPLVVTIGLSLTIPLAVFGDFLLGTPARAKVLFGASLVLLSFIAVGVENSKTLSDGEDLMEGSLLEDDGGIQSQVQLQEEATIERADFHV